MQWLNRDQIIGSSNWKKAQMRIARLHRKIANIRKDTLLNYYTLPKNHGTVVIEQSKGVKGMMAGI
ncbi:hypothetical protein [Fischerella thermalis]|uniref:hypothetical protein n=1 Tax=Fischerella thermalis TaxID=372787 RepID=UPI001A066C83|nr:hypothetical protein [Fischerella thermalis]MBF1988350.1 hypothetical protein [Fischerella thermalis M58_A2018_009]MBF2059547.1 hypothetical protein [Fischerella thermalis M66_A2018_004]